MYLKTVGKTQWWGGWRGGTLVERRHLGDGRACRHKWMDGYMDRWMGGWVDGWMGRWMGRWLEGCWVGRWMDRWIARLGDELPFRAYSPIPELALGPS